MLVWQAWKWGGGIKPRTVSKKVGHINAFYRPWPHPGCRFSVVTGRSLLMKGWTSLIKSEKNGKARVTWPEVARQSRGREHGITMAYAYAVSHLLHNQ